MFSQPGAGSSSPKISSSVERSDTTGMLAHVHGKLVLPLLYPEDRVYPSTDTPTRVDVLLAIKRSCTMNHTRESLF